MTPPGLRPVTKPPAWKPVMVLKNDALRAALIELCDFERLRLESEYKGQLPLPEGTVVSTPAIELVRRALDAKPL